MASATTQPDEESPFLHENGEEQIKILSQEAKLCFELHLLRLVSCQRFLSTQVLLFLEESGSFNLGYKAIYPRRKVRDGEGASIAQFLGQMSHTPSKVKHRLDYKGFYIPLCGELKVKLDSLLLVCRHTHSNLKLYPNSKILEQSLALRVSGCVKKYRVYAVCPQHGLTAQTLLHTTPDVGLCMQISLLPTDFVQNHFEVSCSAWKSVLCCNS